MIASPSLPKKAFIGAFAFDAERRQLIGGGGAVALTSKEFELLSLLVSKQPCAVSKDENPDVLWPRTGGGAPSLTTLGKELRTKLGQAGREEPIRTVHGFGYALENEEEAPAQTPAPRLLRGTAEIRLASPELILGREPGLPGTIDDASVSRRHAHVRWDGTAVVLTDIGSKNGTFVKGVRVSEPVALEDGDEIRLGLVSFVYRAQRAAGDTNTKTVP